MLVAKKSVIAEINAFLKSLYLNRTGYPGHYRYRYYEPDGVSHGGSAGTEPTKKKGVAARLRDEFNANTNKYLNTDFTNKSTGISARFSNESQREIRSNLNDSKKNGFTLQEHFEAANQIKELFENATLEKTHDDTKHGDKDVKIERFLSKEIILKSGKRAQVCITIKHTLSKNGRLLYSIEAMDIKNALEKTRAKGQDHKGDLSNNQTIPPVSESVKKSVLEQTREILKAIGA